MPDLLHSVCLPHLAIDDTCLSFMHSLIPMPNHPEAPMIIPILASNPGPSSRVSVSGDEFKMDPSQSFRKEHWRWTPCVPHQHRRIGDASPRSPIE